ncbi:MAG TPA: hypothetical protein VF659_23500 [Pyrinomonadaceae bacterium]|jgi:hypothetical protein
MRKHLQGAALAGAALLAACGGANPPAAKSGQNSNAPANAPQTSIQHGTSPSSPGVASSHGGASEAGGAAGGGGAASTKPPVETAELDAKIQKAEAKAKASGAGDADKKAAAAAYFERADFYRDQGMPTLYKFALADYKCGLNYDTSAKDAREKMDEIVRIYQSMGRSVPEVSCAR